MAIRHLVCLFNPSGILVAGSFPGIGPFFQVVEFTRIVHLGWAPVAHAL
jgi:hypothetical protein